VFGAYRHKRKVTVFGSARTRPEALSYQMAVDLGRQLAAVLPEKEDQSEIAHLPRLLVDFDRHSTALRETRKCLNCPKSRPSSTT
jgi:hypothetical protein